MDVRIDELHTTTETVGRLSREDLDHVVAQVRRELEASAGDAQALAADLDLRSVVEQQRARGDQPW